MRIIELELHKYIRLAFSAVETIVYRPELDSQIIIGSNGSGKSSLMSELNPLPVPKNYMLPGGYKRVEVEHKGKYRDWETDRKSTRLNSSHSGESRMPSSA